MTLSIVPADLATVSRINPSTTALQYTSALIDIMTNKSWHSYVARLSWDRTASSNTLSVTRRGHWFVLLYQTRQAHVSGQSVKRQGHFNCITTCLPCDKIITLYCLEKQKRLYYSYRTVCHETGSTFSVLKLVCHGISRRTVMRLANKGQLFFV